MLQAPIRTSAFAAVAAVRAVRLAERQEPRVPENWSFLIEADSGKTVAETNEGNNIARCGVHTVIPL